MLELWLEESKKNALDMLLPVSSLEVAEIAQCQRSRGYPGQA
jgi:hypothetical protein